MQWACGKRRSLNRCINSKRRTLSHIVAPVTTMNFHEPLSMSSNEGHMQAMWVFHGLHNTRSKSESHNTGWTGNAINVL